MSITIPSLSLRFIFSLVALCAGISLSSAGEKRITVIKSRDIPPYAAAFEGFSRALKDRGISPVYSVHILNGNKEFGDQKMREIREQRPALFLTLGSLATEVARENEKETPIIFCMVLDPVDEGIVPSLATSRSNLAGAAMDVTPRAQFEIMRKIVPRTKKIGVLYDPSLNRNAVEKAKAAARELGLALVPHGVYVDSDVPKSLESLKTGIDFFWSLPDTTVFNSMKAIEQTVLFALDNRIPFMGVARSFVKSGALFSLSCDPRDNGYQAGEIAAAVLGGRPPSEIPVALPRKTCLSLNKKVARHLGITFPPELLAAAEEVFED